MVARKKGATELGYEDPVIAQGKWRLFYPKIREEDPLYLDPPVKESIMGPAGVDTSLKTESYYRERPTNMSMEEWRKQLYFQTPTIQHIYKHWDISPEHPGLIFRPYIYGPEGPARVFSNCFCSPAHIRNYLASYRIFNWSFFNGAFGENCIEKTVAIAKSAALLWAPLCFFHYAFVDPPTLPLDYKKFLMNYPKTFATPTISAAVWAGLSCVVCRYRKKDDWINMFIGGIGAGLIVYTKCKCVVRIWYGFKRGVFYGGLAAFGSAAWRCLLDYEGSVLGYVPRKQCFYDEDPLAYKWWTMETNIKNVPAVRDW
ncbi:unnamed protein product [Soboliphyme baturini]|uniref:Complex I-B14.7 n=1 Tax=Soboliphyme baturini TaxID=241478 RepID=A0A183IK71_9BILA|nr:unnamed protein product [Soboliphyme baturini]